MPRYIAGSHVCLRQERSWLKDYLYGAHVRLHNGWHSAMRGYVLHNGQWELLFTTPPAWLEHYTMPLNFHENPLPTSSAANLEVRFSRTA